MVNQYITFWNSIDRVIKCDTTGAYNKIANLFSWNKAFSKNKTINFKHRMNLCAWGNTEEIINLQDTIEKDINYVLRIAKIVFVVQFCLPSTFHPKSDVNISSNSSPK